MFKILVKGLWRGGGGKGTYMRKIWYSDKGSETKCVRSTTKNYFQQFVIDWWTEKLTWVKGPVVVGHNSSCLNSERNERFEKEALFMQLYLLGCMVKIQWFAYEIALYLGSKNDLWGFQEIKNSMCIQLTY